MISRLKYQYYFNNIKLLVTPNFEAFKNMNYYLLKLIFDFRFHIYKKFE
jgi:hypothetical protein